MATFVEGEDDPVLAAVLARAFDSGETVIIGDVRAVREGQESRHNLNAPTPAEVEFQRRGQRKPWWRRMFGQS